MPGDMYAVPVTLSVLVDGRGVDMAAQVKDAKEQARKWGGTAVLDVGEPRTLASLSETARC